MPLVLTLIVPAGLPADLLVHGRAGGISPDTFPGLLVSCRHTHLFDIDAIAGDRE